MPVIDIAAAPTRRGGDEAPLGRFQSVLLGEAGGLTQYGVVLETLWPGAASSSRHWHEAEDEFLWMIEGEAVLVDARGERVIGPGTAVAWTAGVPDGHHILNRSGAPIRYLVAGWRSAADIVHYPDLGERAWRGPDGSRRTAREALAPPDPAQMPDPVVDPATCPVKTGSIYPAPYAAMMAGRSSLRLGQAGGLTQFGANLVRLAPGALSSLRHWHEREDEFVLVTAGTCTLIDDAGPHPMVPGDCAAFPAGDGNGHHFVNRTDRPAEFLVIGSKMDRERAHYADVDLVLDIAGGVARFSLRDGRPYREDGA